MVVTVDLDEVEDNERKWRNSVVLGKRPFYSITTPPSGLHPARVQISCGEGFFLVKFAGSEDCRKVLEGGPSTI